MVRSGERAIGVTREDAVGHEERGKGAREGDGDGGDRVCGEGAGDAPRREVTHVERPRFGDVDRHMYIYLGNIVSRARGEAVERTVKIHSSPNKALYGQWLRF